MVSILSEKPSVFETEQDGDTFYKMHDFAGTYAYGCINFNWAPAAILHLEVTRWSHNTLKKIMAQDWPVCVDICRANGCTAIVVDKEGTLNSNKTWRKFVKFFGFDKFAQHTTSVQEIGD